MKLPIALTLAGLLTACTMNGPSDACAGWKPIRLAHSSIDGLTDQDAAEILAHNEFGKKQGCWK